MDAEQPAHEKAYADEMISLFVNQHTGSDKQRESRKKELVFLFSIWNGGFYRSDGGHKEFGEGF